MALEFKAVAVAAARAAEDKKGESIVLFHAGAANPLADYLLIITALSRPHLESLEREIRQVLAEHHLGCVHRARPESDSWRVLDFGGLLVHVMTAQTRDFYALDKLYAQAPRVNWIKRKTKAVSPARP